MPYFFSRENDVVLLPLTRKHTNSTPTPSSPRAGDCRAASSIMKTARDLVVTTSATTRFIRVSIVELDGSWGDWKDCNAKAHDGCTYEQLACMVQSHWVSSEEPLAWSVPHIVGFFVSAVDGAMSEQIQRQNYQHFDATVCDNVNHVIALVISTRLDCSFGGCQSLHSFSQPFARQLEDFLSSDSSVSPLHIGSTKIFVRDAYTQLAKEVEMSIAKKRKRFVITGTPGVGKTVFLWYIVSLFHSKSVAVVCDWDDLFFLIHPSGAIIRGKRGDSFRQYLADEKTMYLCDAAPGREPLFGLNISATTIVTKSPDQSAIQQFVKATQPKVLFMPLWKLSELEMCRSSCFDATKKQTVKVLFARFGGTARETLVPDEDLPKKLAEYESVLNSLTDDEIQLNFDLVGKPGVVDTKQNDVCHRILHLKPGKVKKTKVTQFDNATLVPASTMVQRELVKRDKAAKTTRVNRFILGSAGDPRLASARGYLFEASAHEKVTAGGVFKVRKLSAAETSGHRAVEMTVEPKIVMFDTIVKVDETEYAIPIAKNFPAIDALMKPNQLFQMTVGKKHTINHGKLKEIMMQLTKPSAKNPTTPEKRDVMNQDVDKDAAECESKQELPEKQVQGAVGKRRRGSQSTGAHDVRAKQQRMEQTSIRDALGEEKPRRARTKQQAPIPDEPREVKPPSCPSTSSEPTHEDMKKMGFKLYFVVPEDRFETFTEQKFSNVDKKDTQPLPIEQYALCIDLT